MYASLHNRSAYSFGTALSKPKQLARFAKQHAMPAIALTDRNGLYAAIEFQQACSKAGVKSIVGAELPLACGTTVTLLARDLDGYGNLCRLVSLQHLRAEPVPGQITNYELRITKSECDHSSSARDHGLAATRRGTRSNAESSRIDHVDLCEHAGGLICMIGRAPNERVLQEWITSLTDAFAGRLYVELAIHTADDTHTARRRAALADSLSVPVVATSESRCLKPEQTQLLRALSSIGSLTLLDQPHPDKPAGLWHLRTPDEMQRLFARRPDALENTLAIAEQCNFTFDLSKNRFPQHIAPEGTTAIAYLRQLSIAGCKRRYINEPPQRGIGGVRPSWEQVMQRIERELSIIEKVNYADYFLVFHEIVEYCRSRGIDSLARGSAADSLVCYALGVSHACPFRFDLPFDRFINVERAKFSKLADIDLDLPWDRREEVIRWVYQRWGNDRVAMIGCSNTYHTRAAVAELGKVFGLPPHEVHRATKQMRHMRTWNLAKAIASLPEAKDLPVNEEPYRTIVRMAGKLDGLPRHWAMHPCGLVVSPEPLTDLIPVQRSAKGFLVAQYDMDAIEDLGFVKVDLLGQAGLSVLRDAVAEIERTDGVRVDLKTDVDYSDAATWDMIATGNARGVHHIESPAMTSLLQQCNCRDIDCLTAVVAIIRPGAANQGKKEKFVRRHQGFEPPEYAHPLVEPILKQTYGLMVFEEHILQVATEFAGLNLGAADVLRRALNKQKVSMIRTMKREFYASARVQWRSAEDIDTVWGLLEGFSGFMFNKAHSAEYAVEAFQGAWLKHRWPAHYIAAILSNYRGFYAHSPTMPQILYVLEALRFGVGILPPCINRSRECFSVCYVDDRGATGSLPASVDSAQEALADKLPVAPRRNHGLAATRRGARSNAECGVRIAESSTEQRTMIRLPVSHIKGLSASFIERHLVEHERGLFANLDDFLDRCRPAASETQLLLDAGALDNLGHSRPELFWRLRTDAHDTATEQPTLWHLRQPTHRTTTGLAATLRGARSNADCGLRIAEYSTQPPVELTEPDMHHIAQREMDLLGFPISVDPWSHLSCDEHGQTVDWSRYVPVARLHHHFGRRVSVCGLMVADRVDRTQHGDLMKFVTLGDRTGFVEGILFPNVYQRFGYLTAANPILAATGIVEPFENHNGFTLRVQSVAVPARGRSNDA